MRTTRLAMSWSAIVLMSSGGTGCAIATQSAPEGFRADDAIAQSTPEERRQMRDSVAAQQVADEVGPRVTVRADFDYAGGSRQVEATFHMYDDAYVIVGHLDAAGRLKIVFPSEPGDDGFVRGDKIYHVPAFFAGFADEYAWRLNDYRNSYHNIASRRDSYDAGLGYVFVIASWRPMRLDRITDGNRWATYNVSDASYMSDPRDAIEELGSVIAGDNTEAYTIEYAQYMTTNHGMYSYSDFNAVNGGCSGYRSSLGFQPFSLFSPFGFMPMAGFGFGSSNCGYAFAGYGYANGYGYGYGYPYGYGRPVGVVPVTGLPGLRHGPITTPLGLPILHLPRVQGGTGGMAVAPGTSMPGTQASTSQYRRPGLIAEDAGGRRMPGERQAQGGDLGFTSRRPTIQQMIGTRRVDDGSGLRNTGRENTTRDNPSWPSSRGYNAPGGSETRSQWHGGNRATSESGRSTGTPSRAGGESTRQAPSHPSPSHFSPPHGETTRSAPAPAPSPAHSEPARSAPAASSSSGSKKP
ncbi:MAG TPA: hypothetical protein VJW73_04375 [Gemmatimonadaceae bacterium]|nr:hypothetical protein [Gemmatimonadaceae bacterium]